MDLHAQGYTMPTVRKDVKVLGRSALGALLAGINGMQKAGYATAHDAVVAKKLAYVMCGGDLSAPTEVSEQYLLDLEREAGVATGDGAVRHAPRKSRGRGHPRLCHQPARLAAGRAGVGGRVARRTRRLQRIQQLGRAVGAIVRHHHHIGEPQHPLPCDPFDKESPLVPDRTDHRIAQTRPPLWPKPCPSRPRRQDLHQTRQSGIATMTRQGKGTGP